MGEPQLKNGQSGTSLPLLVCWVLIGYRNCRRTLRLDEFGMGEPQLKNGDKVICRFHF